MTTSISLPQYANKTVHTALNTNFYCIVCVHQGQDVSAPRSHQKSHSRTLDSFIHSLQEFVCVCNSTSRIHLQLCLIKRIPEPSALDSALMHCPRGEHQEMLRRTWPFAKGIKHESGPNRSEC